MEAYDEENNTAEELQKGRLLTFFVDNVCYGIEMHYITEIISMMPITEMPEMPAYYKGIINLRGKIIPVMDVRIRFEREVRAYDDRTCIIVVMIGDATVGLAVDSVSEVATIPPEDISEVPKSSFGKTGNFVKNIGKTENGIVLILDCEKLISEQEISELCL